jgi:hypothetical protein
MSEDPFTRFLTDMKAERRSASFEQMTEWVKAQGQLHKFFGELKERKFIVQENLDESSDFDFIIRKGICELIGIMQHKENGFSLSPQKMEQLYHILSDNAPSQAIVYVWINPPDFPSVLLSSEKLNRIVRKKADVYDITPDIKPLRESVKSFFREYEGVLSSIPIAEGKLGQQAKKLMLREAFSEALLHQFSEIKSKRYRAEYKIRAAEALSIQDLDSIKVIFDLSLENKLDQIAIKNLLSQISKVEQH